MYHITKDIQCKSCDWSVERSNKWISINLQDIIYDKAFYMMNFYGDVLSVVHPPPKKKSEMPSIEMIKWDTVNKATLLLLLTWLIIQHNPSSL